MDVWFVLLNRSVFIIDGLYHQSGWYGGIREQYFETDETGRNGRIFLII